MSNTQTFKKHLQSQFTTVHVKEILLTVTTFRETFQMKEISVLSHSQLLNYLASMEVVPATKNNRINHLSHYFAYLINIGKLNRNPAVDLKIRGLREKLYQTLSSSQVDALYSSIKLETRSLVSLGLVLYQALSTKELKAMATQDVDLNKGTVNIKGTAHSNGRTLDLNPKQVLPLHNYLTSSKEEKLFKIGVTDMNAALIKKLNKQLKTDYSMQLFRVSRITHWVEHYHIREVQYKTGYKNLSSLDRYRKQEVETLRAQLEKHHPLNTFSFI